MRKILSMVVAAVSLAVAQSLPIFVDDERATPDGMTASFPLAQAPVASSIRVIANGLELTAGIDYDVTAGAVVFRSCCIPSAGWILKFAYRALPPPVILSIDAGGPGDQYFSPPSTCAAGGSCTDASIGTLPPQNLRYGYLMTTLRYKIPAPNGTCDLALIFEEPRLAPGQRVFTITANGQTVADVDIALRAGAIKTPTTVALTVPVTANFLELAFIPKPGTWNALVNQIGAVCHPAP